MFWCTFCSFLHGIAIFRLNLRSFVAHGIFFVVYAFVPVHIFTNAPHCFYWKLNSFVSCCSILLHNFAFFGKFFVVLIILLAYVFGRRGHCANFSFVSCLNFNHCHFEGSEKMFHELFMLIPIYWKIGMWFMNNENILIGFILGVNLVSNKVNFWFLQFCVVLNNAILSVIIILIYKYVSL